MLLRSLGGGLQRQAHPPLLPPFHPHTPPNTETPRCWAPSPSVPALPTPRPPQGAISISRDIWAHDKAHVVPTWSSSLLCLQTQSAFSVELGDVTKQVLELL